MNRFLGLLAFLGVSVSGATYNVDTQIVADEFLGMGALSAGASSRLLIDYPQPQRDEILDYLFLPNFGASLHILKVEIGGDTDSTCGTEHSHERKDGVTEINGYEWWLVKEARKRNPDIILWGLAWGFSGYLGFNDPWTHQEVTVNYTIAWLDLGRKQGIEFDLLGFWNENNNIPLSYAILLRDALDKAGYHRVRLNAADRVNQGQTVCKDILKNQSYSDAIDAIGFHYPDYQQQLSECRKIKQPVVSSEAYSNPATLKNAGGWGSVIHYNYVNMHLVGATAWSLIASFYNGLTTFDGVGLLIAVEPWSGHYDSLYPVWTTAHVTQFSKPGWNFTKIGSGSSALDKGGYINTLVDKETNNFSIFLIKTVYQVGMYQNTKPQNITDETVVIQLDPAHHNVGSLTVFKSNVNEGNTEAQLFVQQDDVVVASDGTFSIDVKVNDIITISTLKTAKKGSHPTPPPSKPFPTPYFDDFDASDLLNDQPKYFSDRLSGAFQQIVDDKNSSNKVMRQVTPKRPVPWHPFMGSSPPCTLIGDSKFTDYTAEIDIRFPDSSSDGGYASLSVRGSGKCKAVFFTLYANKTWSLGDNIKTGTVDSDEEWVSLKLSAKGKTLSGEINHKPVFTDLAIPNLTSSGFALLRTGSWYLVDFDNFALY